MFDAFPLIRVTNVHASFAVADDGRVTELTFAIVYNALFDSAAELATSITDDSR
jgi:hypothetical protein